MEYKGKLHETIVKYPSTDIWNDSCAKDELEYALDFGAVGATTNPIIVTNVLKKELPIWKQPILDLIRDNPHDTEDEIAWKLIEMIGQQRAKLLLPTFKAWNKKKGRLSMQTSPKYFRNPKLIAEQAIYFNSLGENIQVKIPVTTAGVEAIEEATFAGVSINATVSFILPQAIAVAEAVERGLSRRKEAGLPTEDMSPVCTLMLGRFDDYVKLYAEKEKIDADPEAFGWAGIAVFKKAYQIYKERGYTTRLLAAGYRNLHHWAELVGGDCVLTIPHSWQVKINECDWEVTSRIENPLEPRIMDALNKIPAFVQGYQADGVAVEDFDTYGATRITLRDFLEGYETLIHTIRDFMVVSV